MATFSLQINFKSQNLFRIFERTETNSLTNAGWMFEHTVTNVDTSSDDQCRIFEHTVTNVDTSKSNEETLNIIAVDMCSDHM